MRTTFRRQLTLVLCLLLVTTILIGVSFWVLFDHYVEKIQTESLTSTANSVGTLAQAYSESKIDYIENWEFRTNLSVASGASENDVLVCSPQGEVLLCARELQGGEHVGRSLDTKTAEAILNGETDVDLAVSRLYGEDRLAVALPVRDQEGTALCIILASVRQSKLTELTGKTLRIFIGTAILVLVVLLFAVPFLTRRETRPLQTMAAAARQIAHGNLDVRVPTGNRTEEIEELAVAFNNMAVAVQKSDTARQEFVANVSHELKTPMTTIAGYLDGMLDGTIPPEKHREYMELVSSEARRLSRLVRSMLNVSKLRDQGVPKDQLKDFDVCGVAGQALLSFEQRINQKKLDVEVHMPDEGLMVNGAPDFITQVLYNLLDNAVKFVNEEGTLSIDVHTRENHAVVTVGNTGPTIAPEELPLIFDRFHKTDKSRSTDRDGVGLGLFIVKTIIMAHGQDIYVTSRDGKTEFTFTLSLAK